ncbi:MAG TPA: acetyltransferase [Methylococcaceae bacterium]|nr:acetyltransferase [Methylococcaceae bacterium]
MRLLRESIRNAFIPLRIWFLRKFWGFNIAKSARISFGAYLDKTNPKVVFIGEYTLIARGTVILSHVYSRKLRVKTVIGRNCLIGVSAIILPGVNIGDHCIIGAGAVVTKDLPNNSLAAGNPAKIIKNINTSEYGAIIN